MCSMCMYFLKWAVPGVVFMHRVHVGVWKCLSIHNKQEEWTDDIVLILVAEPKLPLGSATISMCSGEEGGQGSVCTNFYYSNRMLVLVEHINTKFAKFSAHNNINIKLCLLSHCFCVCLPILDYLCLIILFNSTLGARAVAGSQFGRGVGNILLDNVKCQGSENSLLQCSKNSLHKGHDCDHSEDAGVFCNQGTGVFHRTCSVTVCVGSTLSVSDEQLLHFQLL